jgi:hypothetical protein
MDAVTKEIFSQVAPALPYVIGVYAVLWLGLMGYVAVALNRVGKLEKQLTLVEDALAKRG